MKTQRTPLQRAVIAQLGEDNPDDLRSTLRDIVAHGADSGFCGFCYYSETVPFFRRNRAAIVRHLERFADDLGEGALTVVSRFPCLNGEYGTAEVARVLYGRHNGSDSWTAIGNTLAWYALESVAREIIDADDEDAATL